MAASSSTKIDHSKWQAIWHEVVELEEPVRLVGRRFGVNPGVIYRILDQMRAVGPEAAIAAAVAKSAPKTAPVVGSPDAARSPLLADTVATTSAAAGDGEHAHIPTATSGTTRTTR